MEQGTESWLQWRQQGIGASDSPILLGQSRRTPYELYREKKGLAPSHGIPLYAKAKGGEVENQLRARYSLEQGVQFEPVLAQSDTHPYMLASLDGYALDSGIPRGIEIKFIGLQAYNELTLDTIKEAHKTQMNHQMFVAELPFIDYLASVDGINYKVLRYYKDYALTVKILTACYAFHDCMQNNLPPDLTDLDRKRLAREAKKTATDTQPGPHTDQSRQGQSA